MAAKPLFWLRISMLWCTIFLLNYEVAAMPDAVSEAQILLEFKSFVVDDLNALSDWQETMSMDDFNPRPCNWTGVQCTSDGYVAGVDLSNTNLKSKPNFRIPLCQLPNLASLQLQENKLSGSLPPDLRNCTTLEHLNLGANNFTGPIMFPPLPNLQILNLSLNFFTGNIPNTIDRLQSLQILDLAATGLTGTFPSELGKLFDLQRLVVSWNPFSPNGTLPESFQQLHGLQYFECAGCGLQGPLPSWLGGLQNLEYLDLSNNALNGAIPPSLMALQKLKWLELYKNEITGDIPVEIGNLTSLTDLDISDNKLTGVIPGELARLENLAVVHLQNNNLEGEIPAGVVELRELNDLKLYMNKLSGSIPNGLGKNSKLSQFDVSNNDLRGEIPSTLCAEGVLWRLILFNNSLTGTFPARYETCTTLIRIRIFNNHLTGTIPPGLWSLPNLTLLELNDNNFSGSIPATIANAANLSSLKLNNNQFSGHLPPGLSQLKNLERLHAQNNNFTGPIPLELRSPSLTSLYLDANSFTGNIPVQIGDLVNLVYLGLSFNALSGPIPVEIGRLENLVFLDVSHNLLSGDLAMAVRSFDVERFVAFNCSYNAFSGEIANASMIRPEWVMGNPGVRMEDRSSKREVEARSSTRRVFIRAFGVVGVVFLVTLVCVVVGVWWMGKRMRMGVVVGAGAGAREGREGSRSGKKCLVPWRITLFHQVSLTYNELMECLDEENVIGRGGGGEVYKATLRGGLEVAIKKLWEAGKGMDLDDHGFKAEVDSLGAVRHRNIVKLFCCCTSFSTNLLVYEYMPNGSLGDLLHDAKDKALNDWNLRCKIAIGAAQGLAYLHHDCVPQILHRDIKSNNILLDEEYEAHIADFGLAKCLNDISMSVVAGSYGYIAPEYAYTMNVNEKSDVYSFGVVLLELVTGKRPIATEFGDAMTIVTWVAKQIREHGQSIVKELIDKRILELNFYETQMLNVFQIANCCTQHLPKDRPSMRKITQMLLESQKDGNKKLYEV